MLLSTFLCIGLTSNWNIPIAVNPSTSSFNLTKLLNYKLSVSHDFSFHISFRFSVAGVKTQASPVYQLVRYFVKDKFVVIFSIGFLSVKRIISHKNNPC